MRVQFLADFSM